MKRILIVEDMPIIQSSLSKILQLIPDVEVFKSGNWREALDLLELKKFDLIVTDVKMPVMDGIELIKHIRKQEKELPIIIISGFDEFEYAKSAIKYGVFDYLLKPLNKEEIIEKASEALHIARQNRLEKNMVSNWRNEEQRRRLSSFFLEGVEADFDTFYCFGLSLIGLADDLREYEQVLNNCRFETKLVQSNHYKSFFLIIGNKQVQNQFLLFLTEIIGKKPRVSFSISNVFPKINRNIYEQVSDRLYGRFYHNQFITLEEPRFFPKTTNIEHLRNAMKSGNAKDIENSLRLWFVPVNESYKKSFIYHMTLLINYLVNIANIDFDVSLVLEEKKSTEFLSQNQLIQFLIENTLVSNELNEGDMKALLIEIKRYFDLHFQESISLNYVSQKFGISQSYMSTVFSKQFGIAPYKYLQEKRMERAKYLLRNTDAAINSISVEVGYENVQAFYKAFKTEMEKTPLKYRNEK